MTNHQIGSAIRLADSSDVHVKSFRKKLVIWQCLQRLCSGSLNFTHALGVSSLVTCSFEILDVDEFDLTRLIQQTNSFRIWIEDRQRLKLKFCKSGKKVSRDQHGERSRTTTASSAAASSRPGRSATSSTSSSTPAVLLLVLGQIQSKAKPYYGELLEASDPAPGSSWATSNSTIPARVMAIR